MNVNELPEVACLGGIELVEASNKAPAGVELSATPTLTKLTLPSAASRLPEAKKWLQFVSGGGQTWLTALLLSPSVVKGVCVCSR